MSSTVLKDSENGTKASEAPNVVEANSEVPRAAHSEKFADEKEQRLAEYVQKMYEIRRTSGIEGLKNMQREKTESILNNLYQQTKGIERNIFLGETKVFKENEHIFYTGLHDQEVSELKARQELELKKLKERHEQFLQDYNARKVSKLFQLQQGRELKDLYAQTQYRADLFQKTEEIKAKLAAHREKTEKVVGYIEKRHAKQISQFNEAEDRSFKDQKRLMEFQARGLTEEQRAEAAKKFQSKMNHQKVLNKKRLDHIRDQQRLELRQFKEKSEKQARVIEDMANLRETQAQDEQDLISEQKVEYYAAKEKIANAKKQYKIADIKYQNNLEIAKLTSTHKMAVRDLVRSQKQKVLARQKFWDNFVGKEEALKSMIADADEDDHSAKHSEAPSAQSHSNTQSIAHSRKASDGDLTQIRKVATEHHDEHDTGDVDGGSADKEKKGIARLQAYLVELKKKHTNVLLSLKAEHQNISKQMEDRFKAELDDMEMTHEVERKRLTEEGQFEIEDTLKTQEKEILMENSVREAETKALIERKVLNSLLDTCVDGVISIDPRGFIKKFNRAAERMFGYSQQEILENMMNIKQFMPSQYSVNHDTYLYTYFTTGIKKVIGFGREVVGRKRDGTEFPIHLSISEVLEDGFHLFTAIVRDLTEEKEAENYKQTTETQMMWQIDKNGRALSLNKRFKDYVGITTAEQEKNASVWSDQVVHPDEYRLGIELFAKANRDMKPFNLKRRLKNKEGVYRWFLTSAVPVYDTKGRFKMWCGGCTDIDEAVLLGRELETLQERLPLFLWKSDKNGILYFGNASFEDFTGFSFKDAGAAFYSNKLCFSHDVESFKEAFDDARVRKRPLEVKIRMQSVLGVRWVQVSGAPILDSSGSVMSFYGTAKDIDQAEKMARENSLLMDNLPQMIWKVDTKGNVQYCNNRFEAYVGAPKGTQLNVLDRSVVHPEDFNSSIKAFETGNKEKKQFRVKRRLKQYDGQYNTFLTHGIPILDDLNEVSGWYGTCSIQQ